MKQLEEISRKLSDKDTIIFLFGVTDKIYLFASAGNAAVRKNVNAGEILKKACESLGGRGGGLPALAQGYGERIENLVEVKNWVRKELMK